MAETKLTPKQQLFVDEYLTDLNATQAAIRAGYSKKTANEQGARLLANVKVWAAIQERMNERSERTQIDSDFVIQGIVKNIARCEQGAPVLNRDGSPAFTDTPDGGIAAVWKYDASNALKGYELLGKHLNLFTDKIDHTSSDGSMTPKAPTLAAFYGDADE